MRPRRTAEGLLSGAMRVFHCLQVPRGGRGAFLTRDPPPSASDSTQFMESGSAEEFSTDVSSTRKPPVSYFLSRLSPDSPTPNFKEPGSCGPNECPLQFGLNVSAQVRDTCMYRFISLPHCLVCRRDGSLATLSFWGGGGGVP